MAEASAHDVVTEAQSMGDNSSIDVPGKNLSAVILGEGKGDDELPRHDAQDQLPGNNTQQQFSDPSISASDNSLFPPASFGSHNVDVEQKAQHSFSHVDNAASTVLHDHSLINGADNASFAGSEDAGYQNLEGSVASDPDMNRSEGADNATDPARVQDRSNSVKKPTAFKTVSVTKNFLAKSGATSSTLSKLGGDRSTCNLCTPSSLFYINS